MSEIFGKRKTYVVPEKGMLIRTFEPFHYGEDKRPFVLIVDAVCDEYGRCRFQILDDKETRWIDWMSIETFDKKFEFKRP
jgi:hypothetical protein